MPNITFDRLSAPTVRLDRATMGSWNKTQRQEMDDVARRCPKCPLTALARI